MAKTFFSEKNPEQRTAFNFPQWVCNEASARQKHRCAICGFYKERSALVGHHVIPARHGCVNTISPNHQFLNTVDNCVMVCRSCHVKYAHGGHFAYGEMASADAFTFSHGGDALAHQKWVEMIHDKDKHTCLFWKTNRKKG